MLTIWLYRHNSPRAYANPAPVGTKSLFYAMCKNQSLIIVEVIKNMVAIFSSIKSIFYQILKNSPFRLKM